MERRREILVSFAVAVALPRRVRAARAAPARCRCSTSRCSGTAPSRARTSSRCSSRSAMFGVFFFVSLYMQQVLGYSPDPGGRDLPADDDADHRDRPDRRQALRPDRLALAARQRDDPRRDLARSLPRDRRPARTSGTLLPRCSCRRGRDGDHDDPDDAAAMGSVPVDKAGVGSGGAEQLPPGRRLARDRRDGRDPRDRTLHGARRVARRRTEEFVQRPARTRCSSARRSRSRPRSSRFSTVRTRRRRRAGAVRWRWRRDADTRGCFRPPSGGRLSSRPRSASSREGSYRGTTTAEIARAAGVLRADPVPALRLEARPLPRLRSTTPGRRRGRPGRPGSPPSRMPRLWMSVMAHAVAASRRRSLADLWVQALAEANDEPEMRCSACAATCARCTTSSPA